MTIRQHVLSVGPFGRGMHEITRSIEALLDGSVTTGMAHLFVQHTSASLCISENADPSVLNDAEKFLNDLIPESYPEFRHTCEGSDDMPAHIKNMLLGTSLSIPVMDGELALGTWQGIYLYEHRNHASKRQVIITIQGE